MLVFTRKRNETIMIGEGIEVRVLRVGKEGVRLGVTAPAQVAVHRREIYDQIREANRVAAAGSAESTAGEEHLRRLFALHAGKPETATS